MADVLILSSACPGTPRERPPAQTPRARAAGCCASCRPRAPCASSACAPISPTLTQAARRCCSARRGTPRPALSPGSPSASTCAARRPTWRCAAPPATAPALRPRRARRPTAAPHGTHAPAAARRRRTSRQARARQATAPRRVVRPRAARRRQRGPLRARVRRRAGPGQEAARRAEGCWAWRWPHAATIDACGGTTSANGPPPRRILARRVRNCFLDVRLVRAPALPAAPRATWPCCVFSARGDTTACASDRRRFALLSRLLDLAPVHVNRVGEFPQIG